MKFAWIALGLVPAFAPATPPNATFAAQAAPRAAPHAGQRLELVRQDRFDAQAWGEKLSTQDLDERERAFQDLVDRAVHDEAARAAIESWAKDTANADLAWTARLAQRELARRPGTQLRALKDFGGGTMDDLRGRFEELERRFGGLDSLFGDLQRDFDGMFRNLPPGATAHSRAQSYSMRVGPDGVEIDIEEDVDGKRETRTYKGRSMEEILEANPELREKIGDGPHVQFFGFGDPLARRPGRTWITPPTTTPDARGRLELARPQGKPGAIRTDILGIQYTTPSEELCEKLELEDGVGLEVERAEPNTIASALGLEPGDVVISINGRKLKGRDDVVQALRDRKPEEPVRLEVVDPQGQRHTMTWSER
jgi:hypothetical protein